MIVVGVRWALNILLMFSKYLLKRKIPPRKLMVRKLL